MSDKKSLAGKEQPEDAPAARRRQRSAKGSDAESKQRNESPSVKSGAMVAARPSGQDAEAAAGEAGFLSAEDLKHFREVFQSKVGPRQEIVEADEALPGMYVKPVKPVSAKAKRRGRGPQKSPTKVLTSIRLDQEVYEYFRDSGRGWQSRINDFLTEKMQREQRGKRRKASASDKATAANKSA